MGRFRVIVGTVAACLMVAGAVGAIALAGAKGRAVRVGSLSTSSTTALARPEQAPTAVSTTVAPRYASGTAATGPTITTPTTIAASSSSTAASAPPPGATTTTTGVPGAKLQALPAPGTYRYATTGRQSVGTYGSPYPPATTIAFVRSGCGETSTWTASKGDTTTVVYCPVPGGLHVVSETSTTTFFGYTTTQSFECDAGSFVPVSTGRQGQTWTWNCRAGDGTVSSQVVTLAAPATLQVNGQPVGTVHVHVAATIHGPQESGTVSEDYWLAADALPVREAGSISATRSGFDYAASYTLALQSLTGS
jgi:hypothetical protein